MRPGSIHLKVLAGVTQSASDARERLIWLDLCRSIALLAMVVFHFTRDLELFGWLPPGVTATGGWAIFARVVAGSFIFLSGLSMVIAHSAGFNPRNWASRIASISGAALLVTVATYVAFPDRYIYFGILHCIAVCSVVGAIMLRAPASLSFALAVLILAAQDVWDTGIFASPWLAWTGLTLATRPSLDFLPMIPWLSAFLAGMAVAKSLPVAQWDLSVRTSAISSLLAWPGRHSLMVYLLHQPILLAILWISIWLGRS